MELTTYVELDNSLFVFFLSVLSLLKFTYTSHNFDVCCVNSVCTLVQYVAHVFQSLHGKNK